MIEEVPAILAAIVIDDGIYEQGIPLSKVPASAKKWLRKYIEGQGELFLSNHTSVGSLRKGRGFVYHLKPKQGKTVLDVASSIDSLQLQLTLNEKGPAPPMYEAGGRQYGMWLVPCPMKQTP